MEAFSSPAAAKIAVLKYQKIEHYIAIHILKAPTTAKNSSRRHICSYNSNLTPLTISASGWTGSSAPYSYVISNSKITANNLLDLLINANTKDLIDALGNYRLSGYKQETGKLTIYAWGEKPSINLTASLVVRGGL